MGRVTSVAILGGGPGGYEAALVAAQLGADVTLVDRDGAGGSAVLTDCVPSKTLVAAAEVMSTVAQAAELGVRLGGRAPEEALHASADSALAADMNVVDKRVLALAAAQSADIRAGVEAHGVRWVEGVARLEAGCTVWVERHDGGTETLGADVVLVATGAHPRVLPEALPDGERILTRQSNPLPLDRGLRGALARRQQPHADQRQHDQTEEDPRQRRAFRPHAPSRGVIIEFIIFIVHHPQDHQ
jgi:dihydrolipoamide dehydrogenase